MNGDHSDIAPLVPWVTLSSALREGLPEDDEDLV